MNYLIAVTLLWAVSFSLIGEYLAGQVDSYFSVLTRIVLAGMIFIPLLRPARFAPGFMVGVTLVGALQFGLTYTCLYLSFEYLSVPEVLLFTIFTPLYVALVDNALKRRFSFGPIISTLFAVLGAAIIRYDGVSEAFITGFLILQLANLAFAAGQVGYAHLVRHYYPDGQNLWQVFGFFFIGAFALVLPAFLMLGNMERLPQTTTHWTVLSWLGLVASGLGFFFWNKGATQVDAGTLGIMNNALVPAGLVVNLVIWNRDADIPRLLIGGAIILLSLWVNARWRQWTRAELRAG
jgi:carboxylate/amino acid/amine transporter